jgi:vacuolar protein sorting-associated protein 35
LAEGQNLLARLVHLIQTDNLDVLFKLYNGTRKFFGRGGPQRIKTTMPPLLVNAVRVAVALQAAKDKGDTPFTTSPKKVFQFCHTTAGQLREQGHYEVALRLFLLSAQGSAQAGHDAVTYEFITQAVSIFEEHISDSRQQFAALTLIIGTLRTLPPVGLAEEEWDTLTKLTVKLATRLMKKHDACKAISMAAHLFWPEEGSGRERKEKNVLDCLKKSLKVADQCVATDPKHVVRFVDM